MDLNRLRMVMAPAMASLFLILNLCAFVVNAPNSVGIRMPIVRVHHRTDLYSCDGRFEFILLLADGRTKINGDEIPLGQLGPRIADLMQNRAERVVYVIPDSGIAYSRFVETLSTLYAATDDMHIAVLSGGLRETYTQEQLDPCDLIWPDAESAGAAHTGGAPLSLPGGHISVWEAFRGQKN